MEIPSRARRAGPGLNGMIFLSVVLHCGVFALLILSPSFPTPKLTFGPVYTVSLVSLPGNVLEHKASVSAAKELLSTSRPETVLKKRLDPSPSVPIRSIETRKKRQDPDLEKVMAEIRKKAAATGAVKGSPAKGAAEKADRTERATGLTPQPGTVEMDAQMRAYYATLWSRIKGRWALPQGIAPGEVLEAVIDVTILRSGAVTEANFEKRSGNRYFDESAMMAVRKASPFPPLPAWIGESTMQVGIRFHSSELK